MIPYCSLSALMYGNSPLLALQSHLPLYYLGNGALSYMKRAVWSWDLDLVILYEGMICSSCSGRWAVDLKAFGLKSSRSLGDLGFYGPVRCLVRFHIIICLLCHLQVRHRTTRMVSRWGVQCQETYNKMVWLRGWIERWMSGREVWGCIRGTADVLGWGG